MKIINPSIVVMKTGLETGFIAPEQFIEKVGRTCYKSEDKISDTSAAKFVSGLISRGHEAMIEHYSLIFKTDEYWYETFLEDYNTLLHNADLELEDRIRPFIRFTDQVAYDGEIRYIISGNMRAWRDLVRACVQGFGFIPVYLYGLVRCYPLFFPEFQDWVPGNIVNDILIPITANDLVGPVEHGVHHDVTIKFICDRGVSHEIVRHRTASFAQESTRYCNYSGDKYGNQITVIRPARWITFDTSVLNDTAYKAWMQGCANSELCYFNMLNAGSSPQQARAVLNNSLKTELIMTGSLDCWDHFFGLRCAPDAHPDIQVVAKLARDAVASIRKGMTSNV